MDDGRKVGRYRELIAWQKGYDLALRVYRVTQSFPQEERFGLSQQIRRAAVSVPSNIAEGWGRGSTTDYVRFLYTARGSLQELQTQLWLAGDLGFIERESDIHNEVDECARILNGLIRSLREKIRSDND